MSNMEEPVPLGALAEAQEPLMLAQEHQDATAHHTHVQDVEIIVGTVVVLTHAQLETVAMVALHVRVDIHATHHVNV
jgi:hypothetical protein